MVRFQTAAVHVNAAQATPYLPQMSQPAAQPWTRRERVALAALVVLALVIRAAHVLFMQESPYFEAPVMDGAYHLEWARSLAAGEVFQDGPFFRAPLYPWLLSLLLTLTGDDLFWTRMLQAPLGAATVVLTTLLGRRLGGPLAGWVAGVLAATSWVLVYFDGEFLIPVLAVPLNLLALWLTLCLGPASSPRRVGAAGAAWGVAALARPNVLLLLPVLALWLLLRRRVEGALRWGLVLSFTAGALLPVLPITAFNRIAGGDWVLISSQAGVNLWIGNNPESDGSSAVVPGTRAGWWEGFYDSIAMAEAEEGRSLRPSEVSRFYSGKAIDWMKASPGPAGGHLIRKARLFLSDVELGNNLDVEFFSKQFDPISRLNPIGFSVFLGLGLLGLVLVSMRGGDHLPAWSFVLVYSLGVIAFFVCSRFRVPLLPVLMAYSGVAVSWLVCRVREGEARRAVGALGLALPIMILSSSTPEGVIPSEATGRFLLGQAALGRGDFQGAMNELELALEAYPAHTLAALDLAQARRASGDLESADRELASLLGRLDEGRERTGRRPPGYPEVRAARADVLIEVGRAEEAVSLTGLWLEEMPSQALLRFVRGRALAATGDLEGAVSELEAALRLDPGFVTIYDALEQLYGVMGRPGDVERIRQGRTSRVGAGR